MNDHATQHSADFLAPLHQPSMIIANDVPTTKREVQPDLRFRSFPIRLNQTIHKRSGIPALPPSLSDVGGNAARRSSDLIGQRVPFFVWEFLGQLIYLHRWSVGQPVHFQVAVTTGIHAARPSPPSLLIPAFCVLSSAFYPEIITRGKAIVAELGDALARLQLRFDAFEPEDVLAGPLL